MTVFGDKALKEVLKILFTFMHSMYISLKVPKIGYVYESVFFFFLNQCLLQKTEDVHFLPNYDTLETFFSPFVGKKRLI